MTTFASRSLARMSLPVFLAAAALLAGSAAPRPASARPTVTIVATKLMPSAAVIQLFKSENAAVVSRSYAEFLAPGSEPFKKSPSTKAEFDRACAHVAQGLKTGYTAQVTGRQSVAGGTLYQWTVTCADGEKFSAFFGVMNGKVIAFQYQPYQTSG